MVMSDVGVNARPVPHSLDRSIRTFRTERIVSGRPICPNQVDGGVCQMMILSQNLVLEVTRLTPKPPFLTGRLAWIHWISDRSVLVIIHTPFLRRLSNLSSMGLSAHGDDLSVCISFGALNDALRSNKASCAATKPSLSMDLDRSSHRLSSAVSIDLPLDKKLLVKEMALNRCMVTDSL